MSLTVKTVGDFFAFIKMEKYGKNFIKCLQNEKLYVNIWKK